MPYFLGIDIGSTAAKAVITRDAEIIAEHSIPSGMHYGETAQRLREEILAKAGLSAGDITFCVATGTGTTNVDFRDGEATDIRACARGMNFLMPTVRTVIDIQAQYSQILRINERGQVTSYTASEKCASGSGRFLEVIANVLQIELDEIGPLSLKSKNPVTFTTSCAVFGESEAISRVAEGTPKEDILAGVHEALSNKISGLIGRVGRENDVAVSGGGALDAGLVAALRNKLGIELLVPPQPRMVTASGAAVIAREMYLEKNAA